MKQHYYDISDCKLSKKISTIAGCTKFMESDRALLTEEQRIIKDKISDLDKELEASRVKTNEFKKSLLDTSENIKLGIKEATNSLNDITHFIELSDETTIGEDLKLIKAFRYFSRVKRSLQDRRVLINAAYFDLTGKTPGAIAPVGYDAHMARLKTERKYHPRSITLEEVLSESYIKET